MNAPYDGDRGQGAGPSGFPEEYPGRDADRSGYPEGAPDAGQSPQGHPADMYLQDAYDQDPYRGQDLSAQDPVAEAFYDRAAHPPPPPGAYQHQQQLYAQPPTPQYAPDPRVWAQTPPPEPAGPTRHLPYGDDARTTQYVGVDDLVTQAGEGEHEPDAFAHLFRDQQQGGSRGTHAPAGVPAPAAEAAPPAAEPPMPPAPAPAKSGGRASGLLKSSAVMAAGTLVSRLTGFVRTMIITAALGAAALGDAWTVAYTLPTMIYILTVGGGLNSVFVPQLVRSMKEDEDGGEAYANRLLTLVMVALGRDRHRGGLHRAVADPADVGLRREQSGRQQRGGHLRPVLPAHDLLHGCSRGHGPDPQRPREVRRDDVDSGPEQHRHDLHLRNVPLGLRDRTALRHDGWRTSRRTAFGCSASAPCSASSSRPWRWSPTCARPVSASARASTGGATDSARPSTWPNGPSSSSWPTRPASSSSRSWRRRRRKASGKGGTGILAYSNAQLIWGMPQAIITVSVMAAMLPRISRAAHDGDPGAVRDDISQGLRTSAVAIVPVSFMFIALGIPMCTLLFGSSGLGAAESQGYVLMAFALGLIPFSVQYVILRGFYAYEDTRTPFYNTVIVAGVNAAASAVCYMVLPAQWAVVGMAGAYGLAYAVGVGVAWQRLRKRLGGDLDGSRVLRTYARLCLASIPGTVVGGAVGFAVTRVLGHGAIGSIAALVAGSIALLGLFYVAARKMRIEELNSMVGMVRGRLGR